MSTFDAIDLLVRDWSEIEPRFGPRSDRILALATDLCRESLPVAVTRKARLLCREVGGALPPDHPFRIALATGGTRYLPPETGPASLARWLTTCDTLRVRLASDAVPTIEQVHERASAWLLAADAVTERELQARGVDPWDRYLIRLDGAHGHVQWPAFQFGPHRKLIRRINGILDAADDPWGAADWWLGEHAGLAGVPAELLGRLPDQVLVHAAEAERAEA
jgi:hypothetical protein